MSFNRTLFPVQRLPLSKKNQEWRESCIDSLIGRHKRGDERRTAMKRNYNAVNSIFDMSELEHVIDPYNVKDAFPVKMQDINLIRNKVEALKGEYLKRPQQFYAFQTDLRAMQDVKEKQKEMLMEAFQASLLMTNDQEAEQMIQQRLQEISQYIKNKYYSPAEQTANVTLKYLVEKLELKMNSLITWEDALVAGDAINYVGIINGDPIFERVNPLAFSYDMHPELKFIEKGEWAVREMLMTSSEIWDRLGDKIKSSDYEEFLDQPGFGTQGSASPEKWQPIQYLNSNHFQSNDWVEDDRAGNFYSVYHCVWKSQKKIYHLTYTDENGEEQQDIVDETYKAAEGETLEKDWITEIWEGYRVEDKFYSTIEPVSYQYTSLDNPNATNLPYYGVSMNSNNTVSKSLVGLLMPLQKFYLSVFYRMELMLSRDAGRPIIMDVTQIPKSMGIEPDKWLHYLKNLGVAFINPYETGWDIPGREGGKPSPHNQITAIDMSTGQVVAQYISLMDKIERMVDEMSGVTPEREGQAMASQLPGNLKQNIAQSSNITEPMYFLHDMMVKNTILAALNTAKFAWKTSNKKYINYVLSSGERLFIDLNDDFTFSDFDVFISNTTKEVENLELLKTLYQPAMQNGATLLDVADIMTAENMNEIKMKLEDIEQKHNEAVQQQQEVEQQMAQEEAKLKQEELRIKEEDSIRQAETDIQIALIKAEDTSIPEDNSLDVKKVDLQQQKQNEEIELKRKQLAETVRSNKAKESISKISKQQPKSNNK